MHAGKEFILVAGMTHVCTSPHYPQSDGTIERWHKTVKHETIHRRSPETATPNAYVAGRAEETWAERNRELEGARTRRTAARERAIA